MTVEVMEPNVAKAKGRDTTSVRLPTELLGVIKEIAAFQKRDIVEVIEELLGPPARKVWKVEYDKAGRRHAQGENPK